MDISALSLCFECSEKKEKLSTSVSPPHARLICGSGCVCVCVFHTAVPDVCRVCPLNISHTQPVLLLMVMKKKAVFSPVITVSVSL